MAGAFAAAGAALAGVRRQKDACAPPAEVSIVRAPAYDQTLLRYSAAHRWPNTAWMCAGATLSSSPTWWSSSPAAASTRIRCWCMRPTKPSAPWARPASASLKGPGHRRNTLDLADAAGYFRIVPKFEELFTDLNLDDVSRVHLAAPVFAHGQALSAEYGARRRSAGLHAQDEDAPLGGRHAFHEEPLRHGAGRRSTDGRRTCCTGRESTNRSPICAPSFRGSSRLVDGIVGMEGNGPIQGTPKYAGVLVAGRDPAAVDATCCRIMRIDPYRVAYLRLAAEAGAQIAEREIHQLGEPIASGRNAFRATAIFS